MATSFLPEINTSGSLSQLHVIKEPSKEKKKAEQKNVTPRHKIISKQEINNYRYTFKHSMFLEMLQAGYQKSYCEIFALVKSQEEEREAKGPDSILWTSTLLKDQPDKLTTLKVYLCREEDASRKEDYPVMYAARHELAMYFEQTKDIWLVNYFYNSCIEIAKQIEDDDGLTYAEANRNIGMAYLREKEYGLAENHLITFYQLTKEKKSWVDEVTLINMYEDACEKLANLYTEMEKNVVVDKVEALNHLRNALMYAQETNNQELEAKSNYNLGKAYLNCSQASEAIKCLEVFDKICTTLYDVEGICDGCAALAQAYQEQKRTDLAIEQLERFIKVAEESASPERISRACRAMGNIHQELGNFEIATKYFKQSYDQIKNQNSQLNGEIKSEFGIAKAHSLLYSFIPIVEIINRENQELLTDWKNKRSEKFETKE